MIWTLHTLPRCVIGFVVLALWFAPNPSISQPAKSKTGAGVLGDASGAALWGFLEYFLGAVA